MDQGQRVLQCLQHSVDTSNAETIRAAEAQLALEAQQAGYGVVLCQIALTGGAAVPAHLRQLAAVLLKHYVKVRCCSFLLPAPCAQRFHILQVLLTPSKPCRIQSE
jgi:hypothetical protein